jgi:hypothetical protein
VDYRASQIDSVLSVSSRENALPAAADLTLRQAVILADCQSSTWSIAETCEMFETPTFEERSSLGAAALELAAQCDPAVLGAGRL